MKLRSVLIYVFISICFVCYAFLLLYKTDFTLQDIGRHIINGREILGGGSFDVLYKNVYSYTQPTYVFVNHHWFTGVIMFGLSTLFGVRSLYVLHLFLFLLTACFVFLRVKKRSSLFAVCLLAPIYLLFMSSRIEIRPEAFSYLIMNIFLFIFDDIYEKKRINTKQISLLLFLQLLWVNVHISFIFGIFISFVFVFSMIVSKVYPKKLIQTIIGVLIGLVFVSLINPNGITGLLYPLSIFTDYGYTIVENMNLWFLHTRIFSQAVSLYFLTAPIVFVGIWLYRKRFFSPDVFFALTGIVLGFMALRNIPMYVFFTFPLLSNMLLSLRTYVLKKHMWESMYILSLTVIIAEILLFPLLFLNGTLLPGTNTKDLTANTVNNQFVSMQFFRSLQIQGALFNNYDIGSYLIYALYPDWKVFVDNRPEAYGKDFFQKTYIPMQLDDKIWEEKQKEYNFQTIVWGHRDLTEWGQIFLAKRLMDSTWKPIYVDSMVIIFVKADPKYKDIIEKYQVSGNTLSQYLSPIFQDYFKK